MPQSRIIRMGIFVLMLGVGLWGVLVLPSFSQDPDLFPRRAREIPANPTPIALGLPGATPAGGLPPGAYNPPAAGGPPPGFGESSDEFGDSLTEADLQGAGIVGQGLSPIGGPAGGGSAPPSAPMGMMSSMGGGGMGPGMGMPGMGPGGLTQSQIEEIKLARHAKTLLSRYSHEQTPEVKEKIKSELRSVLHRQFRLQHQRRDAELSKIEKRLADLRSRLKKRGDAQSTIVDRRLEQLVSDVDGLGWSAEEIPDNLFNEGGMGSMMMPGMGAIGGAGSMMAPGQGNMMRNSFGRPSGLGSGLGAGGAGTGNVVDPDAGELPGALDPNSPTPPREGFSDLPGLPGAPVEKTVPDGAKILPPDLPAIPATPDLSIEPSAPGSPGGIPPATVPGTGAPPNNPAAPVPTEPARGTN